VSTSKLFVVMRYKIGIDYSDDRPIFSYDNRVDARAEARYLGSRTKKFGYYVLPVRPGPIPRKVKPAVRRKAGAV
jgi:hypothetical protein